MESHAYLLVVSLSEAFVVTKRTKQTLATLKITDDQKIGMRFQIEDEISVAWGPRLFRF